MMMTKYEVTMRAIFMTLCYLLRLRCMHALCMTAIIEYRGTNKIVDF